MTRPVLYLDVDGVLNALHWRDEPPLETWDDFVHHANIAPYPDSPDAYNLWLSKKMVAEIAALDIDVFWLTTWRDAAPAVIAPLVDAPEWPYIKWYRSKAHALVNHQEDERRPFIWIDDDVADERFFPMFADQVISPDYLLIRPDGRVGITPADIEQMKTWLDDLKARDED